MRKGWQGMGDVGEGWQGVGDVREGEGDGEMWERAGRVWQGLAGHGG